MNNFENCGYYIDDECTICGMGTDGEDTFCKYCKDNPNCYYKQLAELKAENGRLKAEFEIESLTDKTTGETIYRSNVVNKLKELLELRIEDLCESCGASSTYEWVIPVAVVLSIVIVGIVEKL